MKPGLEVSFVQAQPTHLLALLPSQKQPEPQGLAPRRGRWSHSDATLYIFLVIFHTKYTGGRQNDSNVHA